MKKPICFLIFLLFSFITSYAQKQVDLETQAINKLINEYAALEDTGDEMAQARLMAPDRVWIVENLGRRTNQALNIKIQQSNQERFSKLYPGVKYFTDARDWLIKIYGNGSVAVASFYWYRTFVLPIDMSKDKINEFQMFAENILQPYTVSLVLEKESGEWKIVHTHMSPL